MNYPVFFIKPFLDYIDSGKFFREPMSWLYGLFAIANVIAPVVIFGYALEHDIFDMPGKFTLTFLFSWLFIALAGWIGFQLWWDRREKVLTTSQDGDEFTASMAFAHLIQTYGEWQGIIFVIIGVATNLISLLFLSDQSGSLFRSLDMEFLSFGGGFIMLLIWPIFGYLNIVLMRFLAEIVRSLGAIANNTKPAKVMPQSSDSSEEINIDVKESLGF